VRISDFADMHVIDCHVHVNPSGNLVTEDDLKKISESIPEILSECRLNKMCISGGLTGLYLKVKHPSLFYAGGFVPWSGEAEKLLRINWVDYIGSLIEAGFDGIGEMGSKPVPRDKHTSLDSDYYKGLWDVCEDYGYPVLCHVADPEEFWDEARAPDWAKERGWVYYLGDYPSKEELYREIENVLDAHPYLKIVLCHFNFMSSNLERASDFLDRYSNAHLDLALGVELMYNISRRRDAWREFFVKYQNRILFGTDIMTWQEVQESIARVWLVRNLLESEEEFHTPTYADSLLTRYELPYLGLNLPEGVLKRVYAENFQRLWGEEPKRVDLAVAQELCERNGGKAVANALRKLSFSTLK